MALTYDSTTDKFTATQTITKQSSILALTTNDTYVNGDIEFTLNVQGASPTFKAEPSGGSKATSSQITMDTTSTTAGIEIQTKYNITSVPIKYNNTVSGWISTTANNNTGSTTTSKSDTNGTKYYVTALTVPATKSFTLTMAAGNSNDTGALTLYNNAYRTVNITNAANGIIDITNSGNTTITSESSSAGSVSIVAYNNTTSQRYSNIVSGGKWVVSTPSIVDAGTGTSTATIGFGQQIKIPKGVRFADIYYTAQAPSGNTTITQQNGQNVTNYATVSVQSATTSISGGALTGTALASPLNSSCEISDSTDGSGISIKATCTPTRAAVTCSASVAGWVASGTIKTLDANSSTAMTSTTYYINGVTVAANKYFDVVTNGTTNILAGSNSAGIIKINAYNDASTPAKTGLQKLVDGGRWVYGTATLSGTKDATAPTVAKTTTTVSNATNVGYQDKGTTAPTSGYFVSVQATAPVTSITPTVILNQAGYLDKKERITGSVSTNAKTGSVHYVTVKSASPTFQGGELSGTATVETWNNLTTGSSNTSGVSIVTGGTHSRTAVTYKDAVDGYLVKTAGASTNLTASNNVNLTTSTYYITGVTVNTSKNFNITIPNGTTTPNLTLNFEVDANGNVVVT